MMKNNNINDLLARRGSSSSSSSDSDTSDYTDSDDDEYIESKSFIDIFVKSKLIAVSIDDTRPNNKIIIKCQEEDVWFPKVLYN